MYLITKKNNLTIPPIVLLGNFNLGNITNMSLQTAMRSLSDGLGDTSCKIKMYKALTSFFRFFLVKNPQLWYSVKTDS